MISKAQISFIKSLHQKKYRQENKLFIAEGEKLIYELINSDYQIKHIYTTSDKIGDLKAFISKVSKNIEISILSSSDLARISAMKEAPEILALVNFKSDQSNQLEDLTWYHSNLALVLDNVKDPGNLGTIIRIADWFHIKRIICSEHCVDNYNPKVVQSSMGSIARVELFYTDLEKWIGKLNELPIYGALLEGKSIYQETLAANGLILLGSESHGIDSKLLPFVNHPITIPKGGSAESLNVAVAAAIICSEFKRNSL